MPAGPQARENAGLPSRGAIYTSTARTAKKSWTQAGVDHGWPDVGEFPFSDCYAGSQERAVHIFAMEGKEPGQFQSAGAITGQRS